MGDLLNNRYELHEVVGSGGMGAVHRATDTRLGRTVAIKVLRGGPLAEGVARSRLHSEARLAASIHHPGVAQIFDIDEDVVTYGGLTYIAMEYVEGHSLAELLREEGPMAPDQVMSVVVQVANGLEAAHQAGIVHRDLKPANIMLTPAGRTVLVDFGIARSASSEPLTDTGVLLGTADYMSPEQSAGRAATPRSDLYSLGVVAYHCLTGSSPFRREAPVATALAHLNDDLPALGPEVPRDVADLIASLTAKDPDDRPASAAEVASRAAAIGAASSIDLPATFDVPPPLGETSVSAPAEAPATGVLPRSAAPPSPPPAARRRPRRSALFAGVGVVAAVLALLGVQSMASDDPEDVPDVVGMSVQDATARIRDAGMTVRPRTVDVAGHPKGEVVRQTPAAGKPEPDEDPVRIQVASGKVAVASGDFVGSSYAKASAALERLGFEVSRKDVIRSSGVGSVVELDRSGRLPDGAAITLSVAVAPVVTTQPTAAPSTSTSGTAKSSKGSGKGKKGKGK